MSSPIMLKDPSGSDDSVVFIHRLPAGKPINMVKAIRVEGRVLLLGKNGNYYMDRFPEAQYPGPYWLKDYTKWKWVYKALIGLGRLKKKDVDQFFVKVNQEFDRQERSWPTRNFEETAELAGIKLTKAQLAKLEKYRNPEKVKA